MSFTPIIFGVLLIIFRKPIVKIVLTGQNKIWGFKFGEKEVKPSEYVVIFVGLLAIILGIVG